MESQRELQLYDQGLELYKKNSLKKSYQVMEEVIEINPKSAKAHFIMGNIFHLQGQLSKAIKAFNKTLDLDPEHTDAAISLSVIYNDIGKYDEAKKIFQQADKKVKNESQGVIDPHLNRNFSLKHFELAEMYYSYNRFDEALIEYNKSWTLDQTRLEVRIKIAKVYSKKGYHSKSIEVLKSLKSEFPHYVPAKTALGLLYYGSGNVIEAQSEWKQALSQDPKNEELKMYLKLSHSATETNLRV